MSVGTKYVMQALWKAREFRKLVGADARPEFHPWSEASWGHRHRASEEDRAAEGSWAGRAGRAGILSSSGCLHKL